MTDNPTTPEREAVARLVSETDLKNIGTLVAHYCGNDDFDSWKRILDAIAKADAILAPKCVCESQGARSAPSPSSAALTPSHKGITQ